MAIIKNGILGGISGKVSGVVGFNWKGIDVLRGYAKPANPRTSAQTGQRKKFTAVVEFAKALKNGVIDAYWEGLYAKMSGFNGFMKNNIALADSNGNITPNNLISIGSLEGTSSLVVNAEVDGVSMTWSTATQANGLPTDDVLAVVWDKQNKIAFLSDAEKQRTDGSISINVGSGRSASNLIGFLAFHRAGSTANLISRSVGGQAQA